MKRNRASWQLIDRAMFKGFRLIVDFNVCGCFGQTTKGLDEINIEKLAFMFLVNLESYEDIVSF